MRERERAGGLIIAAQDQECGKRYKHQPETIREAKETTIFWDFVNQTERKIKSNRLGRVVKDCKRQTCLRIDMAVPTDNNISSTE